MLRGFRRGQWRSILAIRPDRARNLLESSDPALKTIAYDCGFANPNQMRAAFQRRIGIGPNQYRESFRFEPKVHCLRSQV